MELDTDKIKLYDHVSISRIYDEDIGFIDRPEDTPVMERVSNEILFLHLVGWGLLT